MIYKVEFRGDAGWLTLTCKKEDEVNSLVRFAMKHDLSVSIDRVKEPAEVTPNAEQGD